MRKNPLLDIQEFGQSIWLDYLDRKLFATGELARLIAEDGLRGVTSNPAIFQKAIGESDDYNEEIAALADQGLTTEEIYRQLVVADVRRAADLFRHLYDSSDGRHGYVSLEVNPHLANDTDGTLAEARMFWRRLDRPNVMIKVPATLEGLPAIRQLIAEGINVNVTLLFGLERYHRVAEAFLAGIKDRLARGEPVDRVASVASFFLSRIDVLVDKLLADRPGGAEWQGEAAIASARRAYQIFKEIYGDESFAKMAAVGARPQRLLWASTSAKNPAYSDVKYVEPLIGPETVNTLPVATLRAYRDHGQPGSRLEEERERTDRVLEALPGLGIELGWVSQQLEDEGVEKFNRPFDRLQEEIGSRREKALA